MMTITNTEKTNYTVRSLSDLEMESERIINPVLCIVTPCYNEAEVLNTTIPMFLEEINDLADKGLISASSYLLVVDDGSKDSTWNVIKGFAGSNQQVKGIKLSHNRGHQNALLAGLMEVKDKCDITISIDCDGQDDLDAMEAMIREYQTGAEVVYGVRDDRSSDTMFKRTTAQSYYKILKLFGCEVVYNHAEYRLASARVLKELEAFHEVNLFLRGMFPLIGFKSSCVAYARHERIAGRSKYPLRKMLGLAFDGITSFSIKPIRMITGIGAITVLLSLILIIYALVSFISGHVVPGWSSSYITITLIGGIQLTALGVIGEYVGKIYMETKARPRYIVEKRTQTENAPNEEQ